MSNLVRDGGFETPVVSGAVSYSGPTQIGAWQVAGDIDLVGDDYWRAAEGRQSVDVSGTCGPGSLSQAVATEAGSRYHLSFFMAGNPEGSPAVKRTRVHFGDAERDFVFDTTGRTNGDMGWQIAEWDLVADASTTTLVFESLEPGCYGPTLDDVSLVQVASAPYVALGDSFSSGEGAESSAYEASSKQPGVNMCHRSKMGYAHQLATRTGKRLDFAACSGAEIRDFVAQNQRVGLDDADGAGTVVGEVPQLEHLGPETSLVTLSIGGNDVGFAPILFACVYSNCATDENRQLATDALTALERGLRPQECITLPGIAGDGGIPSRCAGNYVVPGLADLLAEVSSLAPRARILVNEYPALWGDKFTKAKKEDYCDVGSFHRVARADADWMNELAANLNAALLNAVDQVKANNPGADLRVVRVDGHFAKHRLCDNNKKSAYFNALLIDVLRLRVAHESFHPNQAGQDALAEMVLAAATSP